MKKQHHSIDRSTSDEVSQVRRQLLKVAFGVPEAGPRAVNVDSNLRIKIKSM